MKIIRHRWSISEPGRSRCIAVDWVNAAFIPSSALEEMAGIQGRLWIVSGAILFQLVVRLGASAHGLTPTPIFRSRLCTVHYPQGAYATLCRMWKSVGAPPFPLNQAAFTQLISSLKEGDLLEIVLEDKPKPCRKAKKNPRRGATEVLRFRKAELGFPHSPDYGMVRVIVEPLSALEEMTRRPRVWIARGWGPTEIVAHLLPQMSYFNAAVVVFNFVEGKKLKGGHIKAGVFTPETLDQLRDKGMEMRIPDVYEVDVPPDGWLQ